MITDLVAIWHELETSPEASFASGLRRLHSDGAVDLYATLVPKGIRGLALVIDADAAEQLGPLPSTRQIDHLRLDHSGDDRVTLELRLKDRGAEDLFSVVADDVASRAAQAADDREAANIWVSRVGKWQRLLTTAPTGLGPERQRGLYAELHVLVRDLAERVGISDAVDGWEGPNGGHDFQLRGGAYEVKSAASHEPQVVIVNSERQLDETGTDGLHLVHVSLDVHQHAGETLPEIVAAARAAARDTAAEHPLEDRLLTVGYADMHEGRYLATGYTIREQNYFAIGPGFPRLTEADLPEGIGGVRYSLVIAACTDFAVDADAAFSGLGGPDAE